MDINEHNKDILKNLNKLPENKTCADCSSPDDTSWASCNIGIFLCITCAGIHRRLGTHITRIKSIQLDSWKDSEIEVMKQNNNKKSNEYFENLLPRNFVKPNYCDSIGYKEQWIIAKYLHKSFVPENVVDNSIKRLNFEMKEGWICKKGYVIKNWKKRWLKFGDENLHYYKDQDKSECGIISLKECGQIDSVDTVDSKLYCFIISTPKRRYLISCYSGEDMLIWIHNIRYATKSIKSSFSKISPSNNNGCNGNLITTVQDNNL